MLRHVPSKATAAVGAMLLFAAGFVVNQATSASAGLPADKPFAAASKTAKFSPGTKVQLLTATVRNSKPSDIVFMLSMECSIITDNVIAGSTVPGAQESATTTGAVRAWVDIDGQTVPIISSSTPPQNPPAAGNDTDKVTFCSTVFNRTQKDAEGVPGGSDGLDQSRDYLETKASNSFNWVRLNMGSGVHTVTVYADLSSASSTGSTASAYVGNRSLVGLPGKFANDATIADTGTS
ncbi:MAG: hypothetical protein QOE05_1427 [Actinomycetota bacterium]|nr:hypothetical protein [Actinomycetota bacterium]